MINEKHAKKFCSEDISKIENYDKAINDSSQIWDCHHRLEIQGEFLNSRDLLKKCGLYYNVPAWQLIFLTHAEHSSLHQKSEKTKEKMRKAHKGKHLSEKTKEKMSNAKKGKHLSAKHRQKLSESLKGKHPSKETREKLSKLHKSNYWWNNGIVNKRAKTCPGHEWSRGRIMKGKKHD